MGRKLAHHLVLAGALLVLAVESFSRALQEAGDYTAQHHHHQRSQHLQHQQQQQQNLPHHHSNHHTHRHRTEPSRSRTNQTSLNYALISGPGYGNGAGIDYRPPPYQGTVQQHWAHGGHRDTPPQHRRHHRGQSPTQQQPAANGSRRTSGNGSVPAARPVNRMLTRSGTNPSGSSRHNNGTSNRNVCIVYIHPKSVIKTYPNARCTDPSNCSGHRTYMVPVAKRACCPGWETTTTVADGCFKPVCQTPCRNGGRCTAPDRCICPAGFTGKYCEMDVNECKEHKPCDQTCYNTEGSYYCTCREGFMLQSDRQSCKKIGHQVNNGAVYLVEAPVPHNWNKIPHSDQTPVRRIDYSATVETNDIATEARDMENDLNVDYDSLDIRLRKLEQMASRDDRQELNKKVQYAMDAVSVLKSQVSRLTQRIFPSVNYGNRVH